MGEREMNYPLAYFIDVSSPELFWKLRQLERKEHGTINRDSTTVKRVDSKGRGGDGQSSTLRCELCRTYLGVRPVKESISNEENGCSNLLPVHHYFGDYGG